MNKFAVIGIGKWGNVLIGEFNKLGDVVYAVNNGSIKNLGWLRKNFPRILHTRNIDKVLIQKDIESIIIATPINTHHSIAKKCLEHDKNIFVEKPPCLTPKEGFELLELAKQKKTALFVDNTYSFDPAFEKLKKIISRELPQETRFTWLKWGTFDSNIVWNLAYHDINLSLNLYGKPQRSWIISNSANKVQIEMVYKNHKVAILVDRSYKGLPEKSVVVKLRSKNYILQNSSLYKLENNKKKLIFKSKRSPLGIASERFLNEIHKKNKNYSDFELGIETVRIIEKMTAKNLL